MKKIDSVGMKGAMQAAINSHQSMLPKKKEIDTKEVLNEIKRRLESHPGDAPWSCVKCYHGRPCMEKIILMTALQALQ